MGTITKKGTSTGGVYLGGPKIATLVYGPDKVLPGLVAGEALTPFDACYIKGSDGKVYKAIAAAVDEKRYVAGYAMKQYAAGEPVELCFNLEIEYAASGLTPGAPVFLDKTTAGAISDTVSDVSSFPTQPIGQCITATRIFLTRSVY